MEKKEVSHSSVGFCPKDGTPACCAKERNCPGLANPFDEVDAAVQNAWLEFSNLEPSVKDVKKLFVRRILMSYLSQCMRMGLTEHETKVLFDRELKRHRDRVKAFRRIAKKI